MAQRSWRYLAILSFSALTALPAAAQQAPAAPPPQAAPVAPVAPVAPAAARPPSREFHVIGRLGLDGGGDTLATVQFTDGSTQKLSAGGLVTIAGGLVYTPVATPLVVEATIGFKVDDVTASDGKIQFDRWPLEVLASYRIDRHRVGGGLAYHLSPTFSCSGAAQCSEVTADDALGGIVQYAYGDYSGGFVWDIGARVTFISYSFPGASSNGNSFGGFVSLGY